jgi:hypothetical protein
MADGFTIEDLSAIWISESIEVVGYSSSRKVEKRSAIAWYFCQVIRMSASFVVMFQIRLGKQASNVWLNPVGLVDLL